MGKKCKQAARLFLSAIEVLSRLFNCIAGISLVSLMALTVADVTLRAILTFGRLLKKNGGLLPLGNIIVEHIRPIVGTYEIVALLGAVVIGFSIPLTSWLRGHIYVDFFISRFPQKTKNVFDIVTRSLGIFLFLMIGINLFKYGFDVQKTGEVSLTLQLPFYPVIFGVGVCCIFQCLVLTGDIVKILRGSFGE